MDIKEWQEYFDEQFPSGVNVTHIEDVEEGPDNTTFLTPRLRVVAVEDDEPTVLLFPLGMDKDVRFRVGELIERENGFLVKTPEEGDPDFLLTRNFSERQGSILKAERDRLIAQEKQFAAEDAEEE